MQRGRVAAIAALFVIAFASAAEAADLPTKAPPVPVPVNPSFHWTGVYVGLNGGYASNQIDATGQGLPVAPSTGSQTSQNFDTSGGFGGLQIGFNYQWQQIVLGIEADAQLSNIDGNSSQTFTTPLRGGGVCGVGCFGTRTLGSDMPSFETLRGRVGVAFDRLLVYGTGGVIAASLNETANWVFPAPSPGSTYPGSLNRTGTGGVWGGGLEYAVTNNLTAKAEVLGYNLGSDGFSANGTGAGVGTGALYTMSTKGWMTRGGLNWIFDWYR